MFVNFHEMYKTTKAIRFVAGSFSSVEMRVQGWREGGGRGGRGSQKGTRKGNKEEINERSIIIMRISCPPVPVLPLSAFIGRIEL